MFFLSDKAFLVLHQIPVFGWFFVLYFKFKAFLTVCFGYLISAFWTGTVYVPDTETQTVKTVFSMLDAQLESVRSQLIKILPFRIFLCELPQLIIQVALFFSVSSSTSTSTTDDGSILVQSIIISIISVLFQIYSIHKESKKEVDSNFIKLHE